MKDIKRIIFLQNWGLENDAEHSYHLAMIVFTFSEDFPNLDIKKCLEFALIHDLVEIYAWDTPVFWKDEISKEEREKQALIDFEKKYKEPLPHVIDLLKEYESHNSPEARFVYSLDKIQPIIQVVMEWWKSWSEYKIDFDKIKKRQYSKIYSEFGLEKILDIYFERAERDNIIYRW